MVCELYLQKAMVGKQKNKHRDKILKRQERQNLNCEGFALLQEGHVFYCNRRGRWMNSMYFGS